MRARNDSARVVSRLMLRLLPIQILLAAVGGVNGIVSSYFASNYVGIDAMSAVGLYTPIYKLLKASNMLLAGGSAILCGKYLGRNEHDKVQNIFSLNVLISLLLAGLLGVLFLLMGLFDLTGIFTQDAMVRPLFNRYLIGQMIGIIPLILGNQLPAYLAMENRDRRTMVSSLVYIGVNIALNLLFVKVLHLEAFGLALSSSLGLWVFCAIQIYPFLTRKTSLSFRLKGLNWKEGANILRIGLPGAASSGYQTARSMIVNRLLEVYVGSVAISSFAASESLLRIFWAITTGMLAVSRLMIRICVGEEDRQSLTDVMRSMFTRYIPMMCAISAVVMLCAEPFTRLFYRDPTQPVYMMTVLAFRIMPLCLPLSVICIHFVCYGQASGKRVFVHVMSLLDGVVFVAGFSALLVPLLGISGVYIANVLNGVMCFVAIVAYAWLMNRHFPRNMEELMVVPDDFGAKPEARIDIAVHSMDEVLMVSKSVIDFCHRRGIDKRRVFPIRLCMEEMAGNIVAHGFTKDYNRHSIDIRLVHKDDIIILRFRDDCVPFNPKERDAMTNSDDRLKNVGIRLVLQTASSVEYQCLLGLNVLTIRL